MTDPAFLLMSSPRDVEILAAKAGLAEALLSAFDDIELRAEDSSAGRYVWATCADRDQAFAVVSAVADLQPSHAWRWDENIGWIRDLASGDTASTPRAEIVEWTGPRPEAAPQTTVFGPRAVIRAAGEFAQSRGWPLALLNDAPDVVGSLTLDVVSGAITDALWDHLDFAVVRAWEWSPRSLALLPLAA